MQEQLEAAGLRRVVRQGKYALEDQLAGVDVEEEYVKIQRKESRLSARMRALVLTRHYQQTGQLPPVQNQRR